MTKREQAAFLVLLVAFALAVVAIGVGGVLLDASSEVISVCWVVLIGVGAPVTAFAFDRYSTPPDRR